MRRADLRDDGMISSEDLKNFLDDKCAFYQDNWDNQNVVSTGDQEADVE